VNSFKGDLPERVLEIDQLARHVSKVLDAIERRGQPLALLARTSDPGCQAWQRTHALFRQLVEDAGFQLVERRRIRPFGQESILFVAETRTPRDEDIVAAVAQTSTQPGLLIP